MKVDRSLCFPWGLGVGRGGGLSTDLDSSPGCHLPAVDFGLTASPLCPGLLHMQSGAGP